MKRLTLAVGVLVASALALAASTSAAGPPTVDEFPVSFVLTSAACPNLPPGTTVEGTGSGKSITSTRTGQERRHDGDEHHTLVREGDRPGGQPVRLQLLEQLQRLEHGADRPRLTGRMVDSFSLAGGGPARLTNGFQAGFTTDFRALFAFEELNSIGDLIDFATGEAICDPLYADAGRTSW